MNGREREIEAKAAYSAIHNALINTYGWADAQDADRASRGMSSSQYQTARAPLFAVQEYVRELERKLVSVEAALTPFAAVGAAYVAIHAARPQSSYAPEHVALTIGGASITFAHLQAAAAVLAVRAEAVTGGSAGTGISEIMEDAK